MILTAILFALAGAKSVKKKKRAAKTQQRAEDLMNSGVSSKIHKGRKLMESANVDKDKAIAADKLMSKRLDEMSTKNDSIDDVAHRFNSRRVRQRQSDATA